MLACVIQPVPRLACYIKNELMVRIFILLVFPLLLNAQKTDLRVDPNRLDKRLLQLAGFGKTKEGLPNRVAYSQGDQIARKWLVSLMYEAGLEVKIDYAGNIVARREGKNPELKPLVFGSHIDMVPLGGNYDGCVGSIAALEVMQLLEENEIRTDHPLEMIIFSNEEGGVVGSRALAGNLEQAALDKISSSGYTIREGIGKIDGNPDRLSEVAREPGSIGAFLELHIEQGSFLYDENIQIGIVEGIVGIEWWEITIEGFANHAGTTPMNKRQDALLSASELVLAVNKVAKSMEGRQVATVGKIEVEPGAPNVIPGKVKMSLEIRDLSYERMMSVYKAIEVEAQEIASKNSVRIGFESGNVSSMPALANGKIKEVIAAATEKLGYSSTFMPSGAGHDAQEMSLLAPMGMIFIPSVNGISHSPKEYSTSEDIARGAQVLLETILTLDKK